MAKSQIIPPPSRSNSSMLYSLLSYIPWYLWLFLIIYAYLKFGTEKKKKVGRSARRRAGKPPLPIPTRPRVASQSKPQVQQRPSPALSRRSSFQAQPGGGGAGTPLRRGYGSMRGLNRVSSGGNLAAMAQVQGQGGRWSYGPASSAPAQEAPLSPQSIRYASPRPRPSPSYLGPTGLPNLPASPSFSPALPRRRPPPPASTLSTMSRKRSHVDDRQGNNKRSRVNASVFDSDTEEMELDELRENNDPAYASARGTKRDNIMDDEDSDEEEEEDAYKRSRKDSPEHTAEESSPRKRGRGSESPEEAEEKKRRRSKPALRKREIDDVDSDTDSLYDDEEERIRNADSEYGSEEEMEEPVREKKSSGPKRLRSKVGREETDDYNMMEGTMDDILSSPPPTASPKKKRVLPTPKNAQALAKAAKMKISSPVKRNLSKAVRSVGEEWTDLEGDRYKIDKEGVKRRLCEVREMRYKYKMPSDSRHPDKNVMHEVLAEKWLTEGEYDAAEKDGKLSWQTPVEEVVKKANLEQDKKDMEVESDISLQTAPEDQSGIFYTRGIGTPLRTHSNISRSVSSNSLPRSVSSSNNSPKNATLSNGRLRLPSGINQANQSPRSWSHGRAMRLQEDEKKAKEEREKRRIKALLEEDKFKAKVKEVEKAVEPVKLTPTLPAVSTFAPPTASASTAPTLKPTTTPSFFAPSSTSEKKEQDKEKKSDLLAPPSASLFAPPASTSAPKPSSGGFSFAPSSSASTPAPPASSTTPSKPDFFAAPQATASTTPAAPAAKAPSFSFGPPSSPAAPIAPAAAPTKAPLFSFGSAPSTEPKAVPAPALAVEKPAEVKASPFSFGAPSTTPAASTTSAAAPSPFSFSASKPTPAAPAPVASTPFSFGAPPASVAPASTGVPSSGGFSFAPSSTTGSQVPGASIGGFSFGAPAAAAPAPAANTGFSFGAPPASNATPSAPFSFGTPGAPAVPAFNFGAGAPGTSGAASGGRNVRRLPGKRA